MLQLRQHHEIDHEMIFSEPVIIIQGSHGPENIREYQDISWLSFQGQFCDVTSIMLMFSEQ